jgi:hypothetical protein
MACGSCGSKNRTYRYRYVSPTGKVTVYDKEVEAKAAKIRHGGSYSKVVG